MKLIISLLFMLPFMFFAQQPVRFEFTEKAMNSYIVTEVDGKSSADIYKGTIEWIKKNYDRPDEVIITTVENDYVRFQGFSDVIADMDPIRYTAEISIKDNKYKFEVLKIETFKQNFGDILGNIAASGTQRPQQQVRRYFEDISDLWLSPNDSFMKKDGTIRANRKEYVKRVPNYFNILNNELKNYVEGNSVQSKKEW